MPAAHSAMSKRLEVQIWSDIAWPWCYVGKRRFEAAFAR
jgi:predicted DsbA family dithiol-disulfide isomerase